MSDHTGYQDVRRIEKFKIWGCSVMSNHMGYEDMRTRGRYGDRKIQGREHNLHVGGTSTRARFWPTHHNAHGRHVYIYLALSIGIPRPAILFPYEVEHASSVYITWEKYTFILHFCYALQGIMFVSNLRARDIAQTKLNLDTARVSHICDYLQYNSFSFFSLFLVVMPECPFCDARVPKLDTHVWDRHGGWPCANDCLDAKGTPRRFKRKCDRTRHMGKCKSCDICGVYVSNIIVSVIQSNIFRMVRPRL